MKDGFTRRGFGQVLALGLISFSAPSVASAFVLELSPRFSVLRSDRRRLELQLHLRHNRPHAVEVPRGVTVEVLRLRQIQDHYGPRSRVRPGARRGEPYFVAGPRLALLTDAAAGDVDDSGSRQVASRHVVVPPGEERLYATFSGPAVPQSRRVRLVVRPGEGSAVPSDPVGRALHQISSNFILSHNY